MAQTKKLEIQYFHPDALIPNPWNSNVMSALNEQKLTESVKRNDLFDAIIVRRLDDGTLQILGGEHRTRIAKKLGREVPAIVLDNISDDRAKEISLTHNSRYGQDDNAKLADLFGSLKDVDILTNIMPYSEIEIETLLSASKIDFDTLLTVDDDFDDEPAPDETFTPKTHSLMRFKVLLEDAEAIEKLLKNTIKTKGYTQSDALTNAGDALVDLLLNAR